MRLHWGTAIAMVYGVFAIGTVGFVVFAAQYPVELVRDDYYAGALRHDERRAAIENAAALPAPVVAAGEDGRSVIVVLPEAQVADAVGTVTFYRPSDVAADRVVALAPDASGRQVLSLDGLEHGRWIVQVAWTSGGRSYYQELPVMVR
ncbi:MAG TPA: FixH family protein [Vicinamibacterales bacterium]